MRERDKYLGCFAGGQKGEERKKDNEINLLSQFILFDSTLCQGTKLYLFPSASIPLQMSTLDPSLLISLIFISGSYCLQETGEINDKSQMESKEKTKRN